MSDYNAGHYVGALADHVRGKSPDFTPSWKGKYGREFKTAIEKDKASHESLMKAVRRIAEAWAPGKQLSVMQALSDVSASVAPSQTGEDRMRGYEHFFEATPRQVMMELLIEQKGKETALEMVRGQPEELKDYLKGKV